MLKPVDRLLHPPGCSCGGDGLLELVVGGGGGKQDRVYECGNGVWRASGRESSAPPSSPPRPPPPSLQASLHTTLPSLAPLHISR